MAIEIERKFLVKDEALDQLLLSAGEGVRMVQGYIPTQGATAVRLRCAGDSGFLTIKGPGNERGTTRAEFEYLIPLGDAEAMLGTLCGDSLVEKTRHRIQVAAHLWELDVFSGLNQGLVVAEVELGSDCEFVSLPEWVGAEVTGKAAYYNSALAKTPFNSW